MKSLGVFLFLLPILHFNLLAQDCLFYNREEYNGVESSLNIGDAIIVSLDSFFHSPSWKVVNNDAAILLEDLSPTGSYPFILIYSDLSAPSTGGQSDWRMTGDIKVSCIQRCVDEECLPRPTTWIPIDYTDKFGEPDTISQTHLIEGENVLMLKKAFIWENSEDIGGFHGPYARISITCRRKEFFTDFTLDEIANNYCEEYSLMDEINNSLCYQFVTSYGPIENAGAGLPGPAYWAPVFGLPNPESEWIDGPWGACYSRIPVFKWEDSGVNPNNYSEIFVHLREGDDTNPDDFLGGQIIHKDSVNPILIKFWQFGYAVFQNEKITQEHIAENISGLDVYWNAKWDGNHPEEIVGGHVIIPNSLLPDWNQYLPLSVDGIDEMELTFDANSTVGLLGREFPAGILDKPMKYSAPCEPATFNGPGYFNNLLARESSSSGGKEILPKNRREETIRVFPNPVWETANVSFDLVSESFVTISLFSPTGIEIRKIHFGNYPSGKVDVKMDLSSIPPGVYFMGVKCRDWEKTQVITVW